MFIVIALFYRLPHYIVFLKWTATLRALTGGLDQAMESGNGYIQCCVTIPHRSSWILWYRKLWILWYQSAVESLFHPSLIHFKNNETSASFIPASNWHQLHQFYSVIFNLSAIALRSLPCASTVAWSFFMLSSCLSSRECSYSHHSSAVLLPDL